MLLLKNYKQLQSRLGCGALCILWFVTSTKKIPAVGKAYVRWVFFADGKDGLR